jgi:hypothetical protein
MRKRPPTSGSFNGDRAREAGRRSAEARRLARQTPTPSVPADGAADVPPNGKGHPSPRAEAHSAAGDSGMTEFPPDWTIDDARGALRDSGTPAYVQQRIREWLHTKEQELAAKSEPEPKVGPRGVNLSDVLGLAAACGMDVDEMVRVAKAKAPEVEAGYPSLHPKQPDVPPVFSEPEETERIMDSKNGGLVQGVDGGWMTASDAALLAAIAQADEDAMRGRIAADLRAAGLVSEGSDDGSV